MYIQTVRDLNHWARLKDEWNGLLDGSTANSVFLTWEWLHSWWVNFGTARDLFILAVFDEKDGRLAGIAPFYREKISFYRMAKIEKIAFLGSEDVGSDFLDFIIAPGREEEVIRAVFGFLRGDATWDVLELKDISEDAVSLPVIRKYASLQYASYEFDAHQCPYMKLGSDYDRLLDSLEARFSGELRRKTGRLERKKEFGLTVERDGDRVASKLDEMLKVHNQRFQMKYGGQKMASGFSGEAVKRFHKEVLSRVAGTGWLSFYALNRQGKLVAFLYNFTFKKRLFIYQMGFDIRWYSLSPGSVLMGYCVRDSIAKGLEEFHFLRGGEEYKTKWTKEVKITRGVLVANRSLKGGMYFAYRTVRLQLKKVLQELSTFVT